MEDGVGGWACGLCMYVWMYVHVYKVLCVDREKVFFIVFFVEGKRGKRGKGGKDCVW